MVRHYESLKTTILAALFTITAAPSAALAQTGSAFGELNVEGQVTVQGQGASSGQTILEGDTIVTSGANSGATVELVDGGTVVLFQDSEVQVGQGQISYGSGGGGCIDGLGAPVDIVIDGVVVAQGVTSGGVFNGTYYASCSQAVAALESAGGGLTTLAKSALVAGGLIIGYEVVDDDDPTHGS